MKRTCTLLAVLLGSAIANVSAQTLAPRGASTPSPSRGDVVLTGPKGLSGPGSHFVGGGSDACGAATAISGLGPFLGNNVGAGTDGPPACGAFAADVWYRWTSPASGDVTITTCNGGTNYDTTLAVYAGGGCVGTELVCNDDACGLSSLVVLRAHAGAVYKIRVGGFGGATGDYEMTMSLPPMGPPTGSDGCGTPDFIAGTGPHPFDTTGATTGAEGQADPSCNAFGTTGIENDVWFTWTSPVTGPISVDTCAQTGMDSKIAVYAGLGCPGAPALACNDDTCGLQSGLVFGGNRGQTYTIQLGNFPTAGAGVGTFTIGYTPPATPCDLDDGTSEFAYTNTGAAGEEVIWLNRFGAPGQATIVHSIAAAFGSPADIAPSSPDGTPARLGIWDDPNDDGNPADAVLLQVVTIVTWGNDTDTLDSAALSPAVAVSGVYFVGAAIITPGAGETNVPLDRSVPSLGRAWAAGTPGALANYSDLSANSFLLEMDSFGDPGVWLIRADCEPLITTFCTPGQGGVLACPCGNPPGGPNRGCDNHTAFSGGASLAGSGMPSLSADTFVLSASGENNTPLTVFWTGTGVNAPPGVFHGAGVRCVTGLDRLYSGVASGGAITRPAMGDASVSVRTAASGAPISAGQTRYYFTVYRDPNAAIPCGNSAATVNLSSAVAATWVP